MFSNIQHYQTVILSGILFVGVFLFGLDISFLEIFSVFFTVIGLDHILNNGVKKITKNNFPYSGINAAFGICFFLRSEDLIIYIFAAGLAIFGKHFIRIGGRHFFNPSNMGVFLSLVLFPQFTWVNTLQWGNYTGAINFEYIMMIILVIFFGIFISLKIKKNLHYDYLFTYLLPFFILHSILFFMIPYYESFTSYLLFFNISFFIFVFFMISDPKTIPTKNISRFLYSISLVLHFYVLQFFINENYALIGSLFFGTILLPIIWNLEKDKGIKNISIFLILYNTLLSLVIGISLLQHGQPDLVFDNVCNQLVCK